MAKRLITYKQKISQEWLEKKNDFKVEVTSKDETTENESSEEIVEGKIISLKI